MKKYVAVADYFNDLQGDKKKQAELLRGIVLELDPGLVERIKWNAPSYVFDGVDRITFGMNKAGVTTLVLHMGATRKEDPKGAPLLAEDKGLVEWKSDSRGIMSFSDAQEIEAKAPDIATALRAWLAIS